MAKKAYAKAERAKVLQDVKNLVPNDSHAESLYPLLVDVLLPRYEGDKCTRQGGVLRIRAQGTCWQATLECPTEGVQTVVAMITLEDALRQIEMALGNGLLNWCETWEVRKRHGQARQ